MFFDKLCTISATTYTTVGGFSKRTYTTLYENIECNFEQNKKKLVNTEYAQNANVPDYVVVLPVAYNEIQENQKIILIDPVLWSMWEYIISSVNADRSIWGGIDCITLYVQAMKWQQ